MQLDLIVMEDPKEKMMRRHRETTIVEMHERHHVPSERRWELVPAGQLPLTRVGPRMEEAMLDEVLHVHEVTLRAVPQSHGAQRWETGISSAVKKGEREP
jgi:hypothetical protein